MIVRTILLSPSFPPAVGGIETLLYQTSRRMASPPLVIAPAPAAGSGLEVRPIRTAPRGPGGRLAYRASWSVHPSLHYLATFLRPAARAFRDSRAQVVQAGHVYLAPLAWLLARRARRPFVLYAYGQEVLRSRREGVPPADALLRGAAIRQAAAIFVDSGFTRSLLEGWGAEPGRAVQVPFGAQAQLITPFPSTPRLLSVCRLVPRKGVDVAIEALPRIALAHPDVEYHVVGVGPDEPRLRSLAERHRVAERVRFLGRLTDAQLAGEYRAASLFVLPTRRTADGEVEGLGLAYLEAAAWGRPSVAGCSGGEADAVLDGVTGRLVDGTSAAAVAEAVVALLGDLHRLREMGTAARQRVVETRNWDRAAAVVDETLARVACAHRPGSGILGGPR